jgi:hypothetical protein
MAPSIGLGQEVREILTGRSLGHTARGAITLNDHLSHKKRYPAAVRSRQDNKELLGGQN